MAKGSGSGCLGVGCGSLMAVILLMALVSGGIKGFTDAVSAIFALGILAIAAYFAIRFVWFLDRSPPQRTVKYGTTILGDKTKTIQYHDTGKEVEQVTGNDWLGRKTKKTYVTKPGQRTPAIRYQDCRSCGAPVASIDGSYVCSCGRRWGRS